MISLNGNWAGQTATVPPSPSPVAQGDERAAQASAAPAPQPAVKVEKPRKAQSPPPAQPSANAIKAAAEQIASYLRDNGRSLEFRVDNDSGRTVVSVRNPATGELIRQIPGEETLRLASTLGTAPAHALVDVSA